MVLGLSVVVVFPQVRYKLHLVTEPFVTVMLTKKLISAGTARLLEKTRSKAFRRENSRSVGKRKFPFCLPRYRHGLSTRGQNVTNDVVQTVRLCSANYDLFSPEWLPAQSVVHEPTAWRLVNTADEPSPRPSIVHVGSPRNLVF